jgi:small subunit ribosomal protein S16
MLKIRLTRKGKKNSAFFRVVVAEHTAPIKGKFLENLGFFNPHTKEKEFKADRIKYWIEKGAQCSDTVHNLLVSNGVVDGSKRTVKIKQKAVEEKKEDEATKPEEKKDEAKEAEAEKPAESKEEKKEEKVEEVKPEPEKEVAKKEDTEKEK